MEESPTIEPRIQYAKTNDGVNIAYNTLGDGLPLAAIRYSASSAKAARSAPPAARPDGEAAGPEEQDAAATHTILFTDMVSSTSLTQQVGDAGAQEIRRAHIDFVRAALDALADSESRHTGDAIMASFSTASAALDAATAIQRGFAADREANADSPQAVYVGLNPREPIAKDHDLFGIPINLAARICHHVQPGQILTSNVVRELAAGKDFLFADLGETELLGFEDPVKLWELWGRRRWPRRRSFRR